MGKKRYNILTAKTTTATTKHCGIISRQTTTTNLTIVIIPQKRDIVKEV